MAAALALGTLACGVAPALAVPNFSAPREIVPSAGATAMTLADFDGDGVRDFAFTWDHGTVTVRLGDGDGTFSGGDGVSTYESGTWGVAAGDLDGDDRPDLVIGHSYSKLLSVLLNDGSGGFASATQISVPTGPNDVSAADVNGDGAADVAYTTSIGSAVTLLLGDGAGGLGPPVDYPAGEFPERPRFADLNGDDRLDLVVTNGTADTLSVLFGQEGDALFSAPTALPVGDGPRDVAALDVNDDGDPDLASADQGAHTVSILLGDGAGGFAVADTQPVEGMPERLAVADLDGDGTDDLALSVGHWIELLLADGTGGVEPGDVLFDPDADDDSTANLVLAAQLNADDEPDLLVSSSGINALLGDPLSIDPGWLEFEGEAGTQGDPQTATVTNVDDESVTLGGVGLGGDHPDQFGIVGGDCEAGVLAPGASCTVQVRFAPQTPGDFEAAALLDSDAAASPHPLWLYGFAPPEPAAVVAEPTSLAFGSHPAGSTTELSLLLKNQGGTATVLGAVLSDGPFDVVGGDCFDDDLLAGETCQIVVSFEADGKPGSGYDGTLSVSSETGQLSISLTGSVAAEQPTKPPANRPTTSLPTSSAYHLDPLARWLTTRLPLATVKVLGTGRALRGTTVALEGADRDAFALESDGCSGKAVSRVRSCSVGVRFTGTALREYHASLRVGNATTSTPVSIDAVATPTQAVQLALLGSRVRRALSDWRRSALDRGFEVRGLALHESGVLRLELRAHGRRIAVGSARVSAKRVGKVHATLSRRGKTLVRRSPVGAVTATLTFRPALADGTMRVSKTRRFR